MNQLYKDSHIAFCSSLKNQNDFLLKLLFVFLFAFAVSFNAQSQSNTQRTGTTFPTLEINMYAKDIDGTMFLADGVLLNFDDNFSPNVDNMDVRKFMNSSDNLAIKNGVYWLIVERRPLIKIVDTIKLNLTGTRISPYRFVIDPSALVCPGLTAVLIDKFLNIQTMVSLQEETVINFDITTQAGSRAADRFILVYKNISPVKFTDITAIRNNNNSVAVSWFTENENNINTYIIERSKDGLLYQEIGSQVSTANNFGNPNYTYIDESASSTGDWYRIKTNPLTGQAKYSAAVKSNPAFIKRAEGVHVFPNPVVGGLVNIIMDDQANGEYFLQVIDKAGRVLHSEKVSVRNNSYRRSINLSNANRGLYTLVLTDATGKKQSKIIML